MNDRETGYYLHILWKRVWLLVLVSLLGTGISAYLSYYLLKPEYETFTTLLVGRPNNYSEKLEYSQVLLNQNLVSTYREIARSRTVTAEVIKKLKLDCQYKDLRKKVDVTLIGDTEIIKIQVRYNDASLAASIANETAIIFIKNVNTLMRIDNIQIIDIAEYPISPVSPKPVQNMIIGFTVAFMLSVFFIIFRAYMNNKILTQDDVLKYIGVPVIGVIPQVKNAKKLRNIFVKKVSDRIDIEMIINDDPKTQYVEAYRTLRTNIQFLSANKESKCFVVTSTMAGEGKSTIASNLAYVISQTKKKVLLIDGDLRKPILAKVFDLPNDCGLTNILASDQQSCRTIYEIRDNRLCVMPSGPIPPNPSELLLCDKMKTLIQEARNDYDIILIDTPPLGLVTDSADLATVADGVIIVCSAGETDINNCKNIRQTLQSLDINILGVVLNKVNLKKSSYYKSNCY